MGSSSTNKMKTLLTYAIDHQASERKTLIFECDKDAYEWVVANYLNYPIIAINHLLDWEDGGN